MPLPLPSGTLVPALIIHRIQNQPAHPIPTHLRRSQKRSAPSKWPLATKAPSAVSARALQVEGHMKERRCRPSVRPHT